MVSVATYEVVFVLDDATTVSKFRRGAPQAAQMRQGRPKRAVFVARYFPSKKAWRAYDLRLYREQALFTGKTVSVAPKPSIETPDREAAIMFALLNL